MLGPLLDNLSPVYHQQEETRNEVRLDGELLHTTSWCVISHGQIVEDLQLCKDDISWVKKSIRKANLRAAELREFRKASPTVGSK